MARYFIEVAYKGTRFSGFQIQENATTVQAEIQNAYAVLHRRPVVLTGSSRTDAGVHARQNFFHFDDSEPVHPQFVYKMNAILPPDLVVKGIYPVPDAAHSRFDAVARSYHYHLHQFKDPFLRDTSCYFPYKIDLFAMHEAAAVVKSQHHFFAFSKTNTQVSNFDCTIIESRWIETEGGMIYHIEGNRFLRGMVRLLTATQLKVGRGIMSVGEFKKLFEENRKCGFSMPAHGLFLMKVTYPQNYFSATGLDLR